MRGCQSCGCPILKSVLDLGSQPVCNDFRAEPEEEECFPLELAYCASCGLGQLRDVPPYAKVFPQRYNYLTGSSRSAVEYFRKMADELIDRYSLKMGNMVVEIGSNDGTFLRELQSRGMQVLGVEPSPGPAGRAIEAGVPTLQTRFELSAPMLPRADLVCAFNVMAHTDTPRRFFAVLADYLRLSKARLVSQSHSLSGMLESGAYDTIYHEHARYYTPKTFANMAATFGIETDSFSMSDYYGGSFVAHSFYGGVEEWSGPDDRPRASAYERFREDAERSRVEFVQSVRDAKSDRLTVAGIGAPMKSSTLLNYCGLTAKDISYLSETNPMKVGTFAPGSHIPVVDETRFFRSPPDVAVVFSWNMADAIMRKCREGGYAGKFLVPMPRLKVVA